MIKAVNELAELRDSFKEIKLDDQGKVFNTELLEAWELGCLLELAEVTAISALARQESRGGHARDDFGKRNDETWLKHTFCHKEEDGYRLDYRPVTLGRYVPKERVY
jgi:succinate dehydrogenase / fumarate reductase flavoprotein subunit